ncbi:hypothetical protein [Sphingopyxis terrae]|uniref:hypothetical protein n=1 Tax=Sphingopyxis terrae TaxID=33052 RepID=UPI002A167355|nr:hypothetical protein [Sphingopyxis terrae]MDX8357709.1 hypothetical protein [Sphingopyxis terrae]
MPDLTLTRPELEILVCVYVHWESGRGAQSRRMLRAHRYTVERSPDDMERAIDALLEYGFVQYVGDDEGDRRVIDMTPTGIAWFEKNVAYRRDCNQYWFKGRDEGTLDVDAFPLARATLGTRLRDPLIPGAALAGAAFATLLIFWIY